MYVYPRGLLKPYTSLTLKVCPLLSFLQSRPVDFFLGSLTSSVAVFLEMDSQISFSGVDVALSGEQMMPCSLKMLLAGRKIFCQRDEMIIF